ncbi:hypothetical protein [uncultured Clostridium sp.]|jgi:putative DNA primase/helicase|uniref:hypothetical protein n=1 Tax=Clostridium sp. TaxID=1506 RepID=UPI003436F808
MKIAVANSRKDTAWKNIDITWDNFLVMAISTKVTAETMDEFRKLPKNKQEEVKDIDEFVAGELRGRKRKSGFVEYRSMFTLDLDYASHSLWDEITVFYDFRCFIYSTHKHTSEKPRFRLIIPLSRADIKKTDVETVKSFVSMTDDKYKASYGVNVESHPR